jgi:hypothetical protein
MRLGVASSDNTRLGPLSIMSLAREVNQRELEREEDCNEDPATREDMPITIIEEEDSC